MNIKTTAYELTQPVSGFTAQFSRDTRSFFRNLPELIQDAWDRHQVEKMRKQFIKQKLELMTDPTFLDRAIAGEAKHV